MIVNRVWQQHFGRGIVATPNNFGKMGAKPTHPELLDWLANWFIEHDWSLKQLHELIVSSDAYQLAGVHPDYERVAERSIRRTYYWRIFRRGGLTQRKNCATRCWRSPAS